MRRERGDVIETVSVWNRWKPKSDGPYHSYVPPLCVSTHWAELQVAAKYDILSELINAEMIGQMFLRETGGLSGCVVGWRMMMSSSHSRGCVVRVGEN